MTPAHSDLIKLLARLAVENLLEEQRVSEQNQPKTHRNKIND